MHKFMQVVLVGASVLAAMASATAPKAHDVQRSTTVKSDFDDTWSAVIDVFADHNWTIDKMEKDSGLITTDWMRIGENSDRYADCGSAPMATKGDVQVRFNVRVRDDGDTSSMVVNTSFRQPRSVGDTHAMVDCVSTGGVESMIQGEVNEAITAHQRRRARKHAAAKQEAAPADTAKPADSGSADGSSAGSAAPGSGAPQSTDTEEP